MKNNHSTPFLFVYGTLLHQFEHAMTEFVLSHGAWVGTTKVPGILYDLGQYPGFVHLPGGDKQVVGDIYHLFRPEKVFDLLDKYEGIDSEYPAQNEYVRDFIEVDFHEGPIMAWYYGYTGILPDCPIISSGDYFAFVQHNQRHQAFIQSI